MDPRKLVSYHLRRLAAEQPNIEYAKFAKQHLDGTVEMTNGYMLIKLVKILPPHEWDNSYLCANGGTHGGNTVPIWPTTKHLYRPSTDGLRVKLSRDELNQFIDNGEEEPYIKLGVKEGLEVIVSKHYLKQVSVLAKQLKVGRLTFTLNGGLKPLHVKLGRHRVVIAVMRTGKGGR